MLLEPKDHLAYYSLNGCELVDLRTTLSFSAKGNSPLSLLVSLLDLLANERTDFCVLVDQSTLSRLARKCLHSVKQIETLLCDYPGHFRYFQTRSAALKWALDSQCPVYATEETHGGLIKSDSSFKSKLIEFVTEGEQSLFRVDTMKVQPLLVADAFTTGLALKNVLRKVVGQPCLANESIYSESTEQSRFRDGLWLVLRAEHELVPRLQSILGTDEERLQKLTTLLMDSGSPCNQPDLILRLRFVGTIRNRTIHDPNFDFDVEVERRLRRSTEWLLRRFSKHTATVPQEIFPFWHCSQLLKTADILQCSRIIEGVLVSKLGAVGAGLRSKTESVCSYLTIRTRRRIYQIANARDLSLHTKVKRYHRDAYRNHEQSTKYVLEYLKEFTKEEMRTRTEASLARCRERCTQFKSRIRELEAKEREEAENRQLELQRRQEKERVDAEKSRLEREEFQILHPMLSAFIAGFLIPILMSCIAAYPSLQLTQYFIGAHHLGWFAIIFGCLYYLPAVVVCVYTCATIGLWEYATLHGRRAIRNRLNFRVFLVYAIVGLFSIAKTYLKL